MARRCHDTTARRACDCVWLRKLEAPSAPRRARAAENDRPTAGASCSRRAPAIESFTALRVRPDLVDALAADEITSPTPIQAACIPHLLEGRDVVGQARTGSGKTLAYAIPLVEGLDPDHPRVQALVLAPTRELAEQIGTVIDPLLGPDAPPSVRIVGGLSYTPQRRALAQGAQVVVGTPGRVLDLIESRDLNVDDLRVLVIDEADRMFDIGMAPQVESILRYSPSSRQTALFSATVPGWVARLTLRHLRDPEHVALDTRPEDLPEIDHEIWVVPEMEKATAVEGILQQSPGVPTIVFGRTRRGVDLLRDRLRRRGLRVDAIQGGMPQPSRQRVMDRFRREEIDVLIATDVAARGLDIMGLAQVINYDIPDHPDMFTHRTGRTGRMGRAGRSVTLVSGAGLDRLASIEYSLERRIPRRYWDEIKTEFLPEDNEPAEEVAAANGRRVMPGERLSGGKAKANGANGHKPQSNRRRRRPRQAGARAGGGR
ncbi:MAG: DEAD/DEAH box helicase [Chloroflexi bacterium]|nr:DEAD/DEAH box helicase [Chloroflexota bacterium]